MLCGPCDRVFELPPAPLLAVLFIEGTSLLCLSLGRYPRPLAVDSRSAVPPAITPTDVPEPQKGSMLARPTEPVRCGFL